MTSDIETSTYVLLVNGTFNVTTLSSFVSENLTTSDAGENEGDKPYGGEFFYTIHHAYSPVHGYLSLFVCIFGIISNILNIIVLTRKEMQSSTNSILTGLALADMLVMIDYIPFSIHFFLDTDNKSVAELYSYHWSLFTLTHAHFSVVCHTISTWLTVLLAIWRYLAVSFPTECKHWCSLRNTRWTIFMTYVFVPLICIPVYLSFSITPDIEKLSNETFYRVDFSETALKHEQLLRKINFWVFSVGTKLVPCVLLTYLSLALIRVLMEAERRKQRLKPNSSPYVTRSKLSACETSTIASNYSIHTNAIGNHTVPVSATSNNKLQLPQSCVKLPTRSSGSSGHPSDRTTRMLLSVLLLFLLTETPCGIVALLSAIIGPGFYENVYHPLGEVFDIMALTNSAINFILYCSMSRLFRVTFCKLFCFRKFHASNLYETTDYRARRTSLTCQQTDIGISNINTTCV
ncbi:FMRFamide receptor-like protein [Leptotrombidium deliense]|uniref:FMRFamide receptor-like protein n=1 Tax=Leptotrombidium deliense TaxID=299467 RepID=A0A443SL22_9ACAR|nr:FMRFamide receptor-like protein [Leptotrombidium deliense]